MTEPNSPDTPASAPQLRIFTEKPSEPLEITKAVAAGTTEIAGKAETLLGIEAVKDSTNKDILLAAWTLLQNPDNKTPNEIARHEADVAMVQADYEMNGTDVPDLVNNIYNRLGLLQRQYHVKNAWKELKQDNPDLLKLLDFIRLASSSPKTMPETIEREIERLKIEISARKLQNETYDQMLDLSATMKEALVHLSNRNNITTAQTIIDALSLGYRSYIERAVKLVPYLRTDPGKDGASSQTALQMIANKVAILGAQLQIETR